MQFPARSQSLTESAAPLANAVCTAALLASPALNVTVVSPAEILLSIIAGLKDAPPFKSSAVPPVASAAVIVAPAVKFVFVEFKVFAKTFPPVAVNVTAMGAVGATVSTVNVGTESADEAFVAASVTVTVQLLYVPSVSVLKVTVFDPDVAEVVAELHDPP